MLLGILASSRPAAAGDYESIATVTVGSGGSSSITFSSIAADWTHLQIRYINMGTTASGSGADGLDLVINSVQTGNLYDVHILSGNGSAASALASTSQNYASAGMAFVSSTATSIPAVGIIDILDYADTNKNKTVRLLAGYDANGSGLIRLVSGLFRSTNAVTSLSFYINDRAQSFRANTHFALYGIKSA